MEELRQRPDDPPRDAARRAGIERMDVGADPHDRVVGAREIQVAHDPTERELHHVGANACQQPRRRLGRGIRRLRNHDARNRSRLEPEAARDRRRGGQAAHSRDLAELLANEPRVVFRRDRTAAILDLLRPKLQRRGLVPRIGSAGRARDVEHLVDERQGSLELGDRERRRRVRRVATAGLQVPERDPVRDGRGNEAERAVAEGQDASHGIERVVPAPRVRLEERRHAPPEHVRGDHGILAVRGPRGDEIAPLAHRGRRRRIER